MITAEDFEKKLDGVILNEMGRRTFLEDLEKRLETTVKHRELGREVSYRRLIRMEAYKLQLIFYTFRTKNYSKREEYGLKKGGEDIFL